LVSIQSKVLINQLRSYNKLILKMIYFDKYNTINILNKNIAIKLTVPVITQSYKLYLKVLLLL
jgi:hypothetical protein